MKTKLPALLLATAALTLTANTQASNAPASLDENIRIDRYVEPVFPTQLRNKAVSDGYAQVQLLVAADGTLLETFVSTYSRIEFAEAAEAALRNWTFRPAADPAAEPQRFNLKINFRREGMLIVQGDFQETVNAFLGHSGRDDGEVTLCKLRDLDTTPEPVNLVVPVYPEELKKQNIQGAAAISFFIDETGHVRVRVVSGSSRPEFAAAALSAVKQWTFNPPLRKGRATRVFAVQEFNFSPVAEKAAK